MTEEFKIEQGIPIPPKACNYKRSALYFLLKKMNVDDSALIASSSQPSARKFAKELGIRITVRQADNRMVRMWRVE